MKYFTGGKIERVIIASLTPGDLFLEGIEEVIKKENIETAVITSGIGSFRKFKYHTITWTGMPPRDKFFEIEGPVVGVPLHFRGETLGALIVWHSSNPDFVQPHHVRELEPFARIAAANISLQKNARRRDERLKRFLRIQWEIQNDRTRY